MNRMMLRTGLFALALLIYGGLMAQQHNEEHASEWVTVKDEATGLQVDFPRRPLEMTLDIPFQNTPPSGKIHLYSVPTSSGVLVLSTLTSSEILEGWLNEEHLKQFFDKVLVPHLFYTPNIFYNHQTFDYASQTFEGHPAATFHVTYLDHEVLKKLEGFAFVKDGSLYTYFYLASEKDFDQELLKYFVDSIKLR